ncbi:hypothetical protein ScPMuIL_000510 [Solemya velum]
MVNFCAMMVCSNRSDRDKKSFFRLPTIITSQGEQTKQLSEKRQQAWLTAISQKDLTEKSYPHTRVCQDHFISGHASKLYDTNNPDWAPSLLLGYGTSSPTTPASQKTWGGRVSDKHLTENCGFLNNLLPGDVVFANHGFKIKSSVGLMCAEVNIPAFSKGRKQLSAVDVEKTRKIASVRIHVERVIGNVRQKYTTLQDTVLIDFVTTQEGETDSLMGKIGLICCALCNLGTSLISFD